MKQKHLWMVVAQIDSQSCCNVTQQAIGRVVVAHDANEAIGMFKASHIEPGNDLRGIECEQVPGQLPLPEGRGLEEKMLTTSDQPRRKAID